MPDLGFAVYLVAVSYGMGVLWYTLLGRNYTSWMRMAAFPLLAIIIGEAIYAKYLASSVGQGLVFMNINLYVALAASFIGSMADIGVSWLAKEHHVVDVLKTLEPSQQSSQ